MSTRITLRLAGLTAAVAVALALAPAADAKPIGSFQPSASSVTAQAPQPATGPADWPGAVGTPVVASTGPVDWPGAVGTPMPVAVPVTSAPAAVSSSGFSWSSAALGALIAFAISLPAAFAVGTLRNRGRGIALRS